MHEMNEFMHVYRACHKEDCAPSLIWPRSDCARCGALRCAEGAASFARCDFLYMRNDVCRDGDVLAEPAWIKCSGGVRCEQQPAAAPAPAPAPAAGTA